jgi:hypothetical protein
MPKALGGGRPSRQKIRFSGGRRPPAEHVHVVSNAPLGLHLRLQLLLFVRPCVPLTAADARYAGGHSLYSAHRARAGDCAGQGGVAACAS